MVSGVALSKPAGRKGRMAGKLPLQSFVDNVYVETSLSREERKPLLLWEPILPVVHVQALSVVLVAAVFYSEQKSLCVDRVRAAPPCSGACDMKVHRFWPTACLASGLQLLHHQVQIRLRVWPYGLVFICQ